MRRSRQLFSVTRVLLIPLLWLGGCLSDRAADDSSPRPSPDEAKRLASTRPVEYPGLHNVVLYSPGLYSGSMPEGEAGFRSLRAMGIRTIISVDGAKPQLELASRHGLRYVHLPIGYDAVQEERSRQIARAIRDLPGPVYLHCHHGKHRSAAALGSACVLLGLLTPEQAVERMKVSGTSENYRGLYRSVQESRPDPAAVASASSAFPEVSRTSGLVDTMVAVDHAFEHLKEIERAGWTVPADHPDLVPASEAGQLAEALRLLREDPDVQAKPDDFLRLLAASHEHASALERLLVETPAAGRGRLLSEQLSRLARSCKDCHARYRD